MKKALTYLRLQLKRASRSLPVVLIFSLALSAALGILLTIFVRGYTNTEDKKKMRIGVVGDTEGSYLGFGIVTITNLDITRYSIDFEVLSEEEAKKALRAKDLTAYVVIPENFMTEAAGGNIMKLEYVSASGDSGLMNVFKEEVIGSIVDILNSSQRTIYGLRDALAENGVKDTSKRTDAYFTTLIDNILQRSNMRKTVECGVSDGLSVQGYYICGIAVMFIAVWGVTCCSHFAKRTNALSRLLASKGCGAAGQVAGEYIAYLLIMLAALAVIIGGCTLITSGITDVVPELRGRGTGAVLIFAVKLIPVAVTLSALQFLLYEAVGGIVSSVLLQFTCALALSYVSGLIYPISFFPKALQKISSFLPTGIAREYASSLLGGKSVSYAMIALAAYFAVFMLLAVLIRRHKISGRRAEP